MKFSQAFGIHEQALRLRAHRGQLLAANIANADTPGYLARDFDIDGILGRNRAVRPAGLATTHARHIAFDNGPLASSQLQYRVPQQPSLDGNTVELDAEQARFSANTMQYQTSLRFLDGRIKSILTALKGE